MIYFYSGTPGSGKSLKVSQEIHRKLVDKKKNVICCNYSFNYDYVRKDNRQIFFNKIRSFFGFKLKSENKKDIGKLYSIEYSKLTPEFFRHYAIKFHDVGVESQTLIVLDEAQLLFSPTVVKIKCQEDKNFRNNWLDFFTQHRHYGFDIIVVSQFDRLIDPQIRCLFEYDFKHRKINNFGGFGLLLSVFKIGLFVQVQQWYGIREKMGSEFFLYKKKYSNYYSSYKRFSDFKKAGVSLEK